MATSSSQKILDSHFHIYDLGVRDSFPNRNVSHGFPSPAQASIHRDVTVEEAEREAEGAGVREAVFVACYNDCPEEVRWVLHQAAGLPTSFLKGVMGGLDPADHRKLR